MPTDKAESGPPPNTLRAPGHNGRSTHPKEGEEQKAVGSRQKQRANTKGNPMSHPETPALALSLPNKASPLNYPNGAIYRGLKPTKDKQTGTMLENTKSALVSKIVGTTETKALMHILSSIAWWVAATPICVDHAGTVLL